MKDDRLLAMRVFLTVVETGGFTSAAHILDVSQPFVSQTISRLEERLGVQLLHRSTRGQRLTPEGQQFVHACRRAVDAVDAAEAEIQGLRGKVSGDLRVTAPLAFGLDQLVHILPGFLAAHPEIRLNLSLDDNSANLIEDQIDVAIRMGQLRDSSLLSRKLCNLQRVVVASPGYVAEHGKPDAPSALADHNCLLWEGARDHLNRWPFVVDGKAANVAVTGNFRSNNGMSLYTMCLAGSGIMRLAEHLARPAIDQGELVPLLEDYQSVDESAFYLVFLPERDLLPRIRVFIDHLVEHYRTPPW